MRREEGCIPGIVVVSQHVSLAIHCRAQSLSRILSEAADSSVAQSFVDHFNCNFFHVTNDDVSANARPSRPP